MSTPLGAEPSVFRPAIEGLFLKELGPRLDVPLRGELKNLGLDLEHLEASYSTRLLDDCLELVADRVLADLPHDEAMRELGRLQVRGFVHSPIGGAVFLMARLLTREQLLTRLMRLWRSANNFVRIELHPQTPQAWELALDHVGRHPQMMTGLLEELLENAGQPCRAEVIASCNLAARYRVTFVR
jgi:uncharacterized protein (TIGR02265 family)